jgi:tetratricopeptide (TPR) repeat protein
MNPRFAMAYYYRGLLCHVKPDQAISDYTEAIEIDPWFAVAYAERVFAYYRNREYDKAWEDVHKAESLGQQIRPGFLKVLLKDSGRQR